MTFTATNIQEAHVVFTVSQTHLASRPWDNGAFSHALDTAVVYMSTCLVIHNVCGQNAHV